MVDLFLMACNNDRMTTNQESISFDLNASWPSEVEVPLPANQIAVLPSVNIGPVVSDTVELRFGYLSSPLITASDPESARRQFEALDLQVKVVGNYAVSVEFLKQIRDQLTVVIDHHESMKRQAPDQGQI